VEKVIESISFLFEGQRVRVSVSSDGTFRVPFTPSVKTTRHRNGNVRYRNLTARQVINDKRIKLNDPVLTLVTGEKVRVFQGGDSTYLPAATDGIITRHDKAKRLPTSSALKKNGDTVSSKQYDFDWNGLGLDDYDDFF